MKVDIVVMRHPNVGAGVFLSRHVDAKIINAGDGTHEHPTQALLDSYSIKEKLGTVKGKKIVIVGDILHSRVALSNIFALKLQGAEVKVCGPTTLIPKYISSLGVEVETNIKKALDDGWVITFPQGTTTPFKPIRRGTAHIIKTYKPIVVPIVIDGLSLIHI